jgi:hypothetical protein
MEMSSLYIIVVCGGIYHVLGRKRSDFLTISFFSMVVYFSPGLVGFVSNPYYPGVMPYIPVQLEVYYVFFIALVSNLIFSAYSDFYYKEETGTANMAVVSGSTKTIILSILIIFFILSLVESGSALFNADKSVVLESRGRMLVFFSVIAQVALFVGLTNPSRVLTPVSILAMAFLVFIGFRSYFAIAMIAVAGKFILSRSVRSLFNPASATLVVAVSLFVLMYKQFYIFIKMGRSDLASDRLYSDGLFYKTIFSSEPFLTQFILNETIIREYSEPVLKTLSSFLLIVPGLTQFAGISNDSLNFDFQEVLLPTISYGVGSNIYAHWFASLGWLGVILFTLVHNGVLLYLSSLAKRGGEVLSTTAFLCASFLAFYVNRNDMFFTMQVVERYILVGVVLAVVGYIIKAKPKTIC